MHRDTFAWKKNFVLSCRLMAWLLAKRLTREMGQLNQEGASLSATLLTVCQKAAIAGSAAAASAASTASCGSTESVRLGTSACLELVHLQSWHPM